MLPSTIDAALVLAALAHPADNATSTTLTQTAATAVEANAFEEFVVSLLLKDPETGAKAADLTLWTKDTADGTVGDGTWTAIAAADLERLAGKVHDPVLAASAAYSDVHEWVVPMRLASKTFIAAKVVVTHADPTATPLTYMALMVRGKNARRA